MTEAAGLQARLHFKLYELVWSLSQINFPGVFPDRPLSSNILPNRWTCSKSIGWCSPLCAAWRLLVDMTELAQSYIAALHPPSPARGCPAGLRLFWRHQREDEKLALLAEFAQEIRRYFHTCLRDLTHLPWCVQGIEPHYQWQGSVVPCNAAACWHFTQAARQFSTQLLCCFYLVFVSGSHKHNSGHIHWNLWGTHPHSLS